MKLFNVNKTKLKHGTYATAITAVVIVAVIILNILMSVLSNKGLLKVDLSLTGKNSITAENQEFIKNIDKEITVKVFSTANSYKDGTLADFAENYKTVVDDSNYYSQTITLLDLYSQLNQKINIQYIDFYSDETEKYAESYPSLFYGDMVVEYKIDAENTKSRLVTFDDIYSYSDSSGGASYGYSSYYIDGNNLETALSSAINTLISGEERELALLANHSNETYFDSLYSSTLKVNSFNLSKITDSILTSIPDEIDVLVIAAPTSDFLPQEISVINQWLNNNEKLSRSLIFFPGVSMDKLPVLKEFLSEWGINYESGILYQTDSGQHADGDPTTMVCYANEGKMASEILEGESNIILGSNLAMNTAYETYSSRTTNIIASTNDMVAIKPSSASEDWKPASNAKLSSMPNLIITKEESVIDNKQYLGYVAAFSSIEFIYSDWAQYDSLLNMDAAINTAIYTSGMDSANKMTFVPKKITLESFSDKVTESSGFVIKLIFAVVIPVALVASGFVVWFRRKRK